MASPDSVMSATPPPVTILVVDDDPGLTRLIGRALQREGYQTTAVGSGLEATEWLKQHRADLLLLDLKDLRALLVWATDHAKEISQHYGLIAPASIAPDSCGLVPAAVQTRSRPARLGPRSSLLRRSRSLTSLASSAAAAGGVPRPIAAVSTEQRTSRGAPRIAG